MTMGRISVLDVLRGIAAVMVVLFHYSKFWNEETIVYSLFSYGYTGVMLFFMISGFVIFLSVNKCESSKDFLIKRFTRLYPTFWICLALTTFFVKVFGLPGREVSWNDILINLTMIPKVLGFKDVDGVYWTLCYEFFFYIFIAILFRLRIIKDIYLWIIPWMLLCVIHNSLFVFPKAIAFLFNFKYGLYFISGILFYTLKFQEQKKIQVHLMVLICLIFSILNSKDRVESLFVVFYFFCFYLFVYEKLNWIVNKFFLFFGTISYPLYLLHQNIGYIILNKLKNYTDNISCIIIPLFFSIFLAYMVHLYVEEPVQRYLKLNKLK